MPTGMLARIARSIGMWRSLPGVRRGIRGSTPEAASLRTPPQGVKWAARRSGLADVRRLQPLGTAHDVELERFALGERLEPLAGDGREMHEHVLAAVRLGDEAKALRLVEPLHSATRHLELLV